MKLNWFASELADMIIEQRQKVIFDSFFTSVSRSTYYRYFKSTKTAKLLENVHGYSWKDAKDKTTHYVMVNMKQRKYRKNARKSMKALLPKASAKQAEVGGKLGFGNIKIAAPDGYEVILAVEKQPRNLKGDYWFKFSDEFSGNRARLGKMNYIEKEIMSAIKKWARLNRFKVDVEMR